VESSGSLCILFVAWPEPLASYAMCFAIWYLYPVQREVNGQGKSKCATGTCILPINRLASYSRLSYATTAISALRNQLFSAPISLSSQLGHHETMRLSPRQCFGTYIRSGCVAERNSVPRTSSPVSRFTVALFGVLHTVQLA
jgi:hypothetical protein